jgi:hypothetical protein
MNTGSKLAAFALALAATFGGAMAVGAGVGPLDVGGAESGHAAHQSGHESGGADAARGVSMAEAGYRFVPEARPFGGGALAAGAPTPFAFRIVDAEGTAVTSFETLHERKLHLVVLSRNLVDYLHVHPTMDPAGRWTVDLPALAPGSYRVFADFQPTGADNLVLGTDLTVPGNVPAVSVPQPATVARVDGYTVALIGAPTTGSVAIGFRIERDGVPVRTDPYLGAAGHLVAIRAGDLAYLHVHPEPNGDDAVVTFMTELPTPGTYRLFFEFAHDGAVHTASFTVEVH